jgi:hypothetical protein
VSEEFDTRGLARALAGRIRGEVRDFLRDYPVPADAVPGVA